MIIDTLSHAGNYTSLTPGIAMAFKFLKRPDLATLQPGKHLIDADKIFALIQDYTTRPAGDCRWESHRRYVDVQFVLSGREQMGWAPLDLLQVTKPYDAEKDVQFLSGSGTMLPAPAGTFVIFMPHDAHMPCVADGDTCPVRKIVIKVAVE
jgi:YhcH/YjgK/YiaL family protein